MAEPGQHLGAEGATRYQGHIADIDKGKPDLSGGSSGNVRRRTVLAEHRLLLLVGILQLGVPAGARNRGVLLDGHDGEVATGEGSVPVAEGVGGRSRVGVWRRSHIQVAPGSDPRKR